MSTRPRNVVIAGKIWCLVVTPFTTAGADQLPPRSIDRASRTSASPVRKSAHVMKTEPVVSLTAIRGKLSRRYALPGSGSGTGTIVAIPRSVSNVWPQSKDRVNRIWSLWKSSQATCTSPPGPTATVVPWFCVFGEWLSGRIGVQVRPPSVDRWNTTFVPWLPSKRAHGMYRFPSQDPPVSSTAIHSLSVTREVPGPPSLALGVSWPANTTDVKSYVAPKSEYRVRTTQPANSVVLGPNASHARTTR